MSDQEQESRKMKKRKVKAWCSECFQTFENGPFTKICKEHVTRGRCNVFECRKQIYKRGDSGCIRKFPNSNSENRHTYCITHEEVKDWKDSCNIQNCLGVKRSAEIPFGLEKVPNFAVKRELNFDLMAKAKEDQKEEDKSAVKEEKKTSGKAEDKVIKELSFFDNLLPTLDLEYRLIDDIKNLSFFEGEKFSLDDNLINEFNNFCFAPVKSENQIKTFNDSPKKVPEAEENKTENKSPDKINNAEVKDEENIDSIFERVHSETKIPKSILNKLKSAFKKKGILNAKILRLFKAKKKNFNFLIDDFSKVCTQIEGVALYLENLL